MPFKITELIVLIRDVKEKITDDSDMVWTCYDNPKQLREELDFYIRQFELADLSSIEKLNYLFSPTASLQEHSICNGWAEEYIELSKKFDRLYSMIEN